MFEKLPPPPRPRRHAMPPQVGNVIPNKYRSLRAIGDRGAHRTGIVRRDLKPDNVMITRGSRGDTCIKLLDFGIAKLKVTGQFDRGLTRPGVIMGTPEYMAPEQAYSADAVDSRADIF